MVQASDRSIDTPALLLDVKALTRNIARMASFAAQAGVSLRPHAKTHKSPIIAARQLQAGAIGITCQKLGEAEVMAEAGIRGLLIANQIVGEHKIGRLLDLARRTEIMVAVDDPANVAALSAAASQAGVTVGVVVEVDVGMHRCGVGPGEPTLRLARQVVEAPGLKLGGLMGYEGHAVMIEDAADRRQVAAEALRQLVDTAGLLRGQGMAVEIVSSTGTGTFDTGGTFPGVTEMQVGSYATMDGRYLQVGVPFEPALSILASVISTPQPGLAIIDAGIKSISTDFGLPQVIDPQGAEVKRLSEEHGFVALPPGTHLRPTDRVRLRPMHGCTTINLHDRYVVLRDGVVEAEWPVAARGRSR